MKRFGSDLGDSGVDLAVYGCVWLNVIIYGCCISLYMPNNGCDAAAAAAAQHDYTFNFSKTCAFRPELA